MLLALAVVIVAINISQQQSHLDVLMLVAMFLPFAAYAVDNKRIDFKQY